MIKYITVDELHQEGDVIDCSQLHLFSLHDLEKLYNIEGNLVNLNVYYRHLLNNYNT